LGFRIWDLGLRFYLWSAWPYR